MIASNFLVEKYFILICSGKFRWVILVNEGLKLENNTNSSDKRKISLPVDKDRRAENPITAAIRDNIKNESGLVYALEALPPIRRIVSLPDKIGNGDVASAVGLAGLALINLPEDVRDIKGAIKQLKGEAPKYNHKEFQHNFSFFRGTAVEKWLNGQVDAGKKWAVFLRENDRTLADTKLGKKIMDAVKCKDVDIIETSIQDYKKTNINAVKHSGSEFAQLTGRALRRTTLLGVGAIVLLELPKIIKSDETIKQTAKSAINIASVTAGIGYGGAIGSKYGGATGSLIGMGFGAILGSKLSEKTQALIS